MFPVPARAQFEQNLVGDFTLAYSDDSTPDTRDDWRESWSFYNRDNPVHLELQEAADMAAIGADMTVLLHIDAARDWMVEDIARLPGWNTYKPARWQRIENDMVVMDHQTAQMMVNHALRTPQTLNNLSRLAQMIGQDLETEFGDTETH